MSKHEVRIKIGEKWHTVEVDNLEYSPITVKVDGESFEFEIPDLPLKSNQQPAEPESSVDMPENTSNDSVINSPIAGKILAIKNEFIPPTINLNYPDPECDLNFVPNNYINKKINYAMSNTFGFGGHNAVLLFKRYDE